MLRDISFHRENCLQHLLQKPVSFFLVSHVNLIRNFINLFLGYTAIQFLEYHSRIMTEDYNFTYIHYSTMLYALM